MKAQGMTPTTSCACKSTYKSSWKRTTSANMLRCLCSKSAMFFCSCGQEKGRMTLPPFLSPSHFSARMHAQVLWIPQP